MSTTIPKTIAPGQQVTKDPDGEVLYHMDWTLWLAGLSQSDAQISTTSIGITPTGGLAVDNDSIVTGGKKVQFRLTDGTVGVTYTVRVRITTDETPAQTDDRSFTVVVAER